MKKFLKVFWIICALLLGAGCGIKEKKSLPEKLLDRPFESNVSVSWHDAEYRGILKKTADGALTLQINGENLAEPLTFFCGEGGCRIEQGTQTFSVPQGSLPSEALLCCLERALVMLHHADISTKEDEMLLKAGTTQLYCNKEDGVFISLLLDRGKIDFSGFVFSNT